MLIGEAWYEKSDPTRYKWWIIPCNPWGRNHLISVFTFLPILYLLIQLKVIVEGAFLNTVFIAFALWSLFGFMFKTKPMKNKRQVISETAEMWKFPNFIIVILFAVVFLALKKYLRGL